MKQDLTTSVFAAVVGALVAFFVCNMFLPELTDVTFSTLGENETFTLAEPDSEVFNYRSVNPTVEVIINCTDVDENGVCKDTIEIDGGGGNNNQEEEQQEEEQEEEQQEEQQEEENQQENENSEQNGENENGTSD